MDSAETLWIGWVCEKDQLIQFWWRFKSEYENFFKAIPSPLRDGLKNDISHDITQSCGQTIETILGGLVGSMTRTSRLDFGKGPDADPAHRWNRKQTVQLSGGMRSPKHPRLAMYSMGRIKYFGVQIHIYPFFPQEKSKNSKYMTILWPPMSNTWFFILYSYMRHDRSMIKWIVFK